MNTISTTSNKFNFKNLNLDLENDNSGDKSGTSGKAGTGLSS
jgi:hypothetical protein